MKKSGRDRLSLSFLERVFGINMSNGDDATCRPSKQSASRKPSANIMNPDRVSVEVADRIRLVQAYLRISEVDIRRSLVALVEHVANGGAPAELTIHNTMGNRQRTRKTRRLS
jgi:hypothetical protein